MVKLDLHILHPLKVTRNVTKHRTFSEFGSILKPSCVCSASTIGVSLA